MTAANPWANNPDVFNVGNPITFDRNAPVSGAGTPAFFNTGVNNTPTAQSGGTGYDWSGMSAPFNFGSYGSNGSSFDLASVPQNNALANIQANQDNQTGGIGSLFGNGFYTDPSNPNSGANANSNPLLNFFGLNPTPAGGGSAQGGYLNQYFVRGALAVLGCIFVAVGLSLFHQNGGTATLAKVAGVK